MFPHLSSQPLWLWFTMKADIQTSGQCSVFIAILIRIILKSVQSNVHFNLNITTTPLVHAVAVCNRGILCGPRVEFTNFECILYQFWFYFAVPVWAVITIIVAILLVIIVISVCICIKCCCKNKGGKDKKKKGGMFGGKETLCTHWYDLIDQWCL